MNGFSPMFLWHTAGHRREEQCKKSHYVSNYPHEAKLNELYQLDKNSPTCFIYATPAIQEIILFTIGNIYQSSRSLIMIKDI